MDPQLSSFVVSPKETEHILECLSELQSETKATHVILIERSGQVIAAKNDTQEENKPVLGALLAGSFASSREIARVLNERDFRTLIQQGKYESIFAELIEDTWILSIIFPKTTPLGMVQIFAKKGVAQLTEILERVKKESRSTKISVFSNLMRTSDVNDTVDLLFKDLAS